MENLLLKPQVLLLTYTDSNNCTNDSTISVKVIQTDASFTSLRTNNVYCYDGGTDVITVETDTSIIASGIFSGAGLTQVDSASFVFDPVAAGQGTHTITYDYFNMVGTPFTITTNLYVDSIGLVDFIGMADEYCVTSANAQMTALAPPGGTSAWTGPDPGFFYNNRTGTLQPTLLSPGFYDITYLYTSSTGLCQASVTRQVEINALPVVNFTIRPIFNVAEAPVTLSGTPAQGTFSGIGVSPADSTFNPATAGIRLDLPVTYTYTDTNYCTNSITKTVDIVSSDAAFTSLRPNSVYCYDGGTDLIIVETDTSVIASGTFTGAGVTQVDSASFIFDPVTAGQGTRKIT